MGKFLFKIFCNKKRLESFFIAFPAVWQFPLTRKNIVVNHNDRNCFNCQPERNNTILFLYPKYFFHTPQVR